MVSIFRPGSGEVTPNAPHRHTAIVKDKSSGILEVLPAGSADAPVCSSAGAPRIAHIVPALFGGPDGIVGGAERYAYELAHSMAEVAATELITFGKRDRREVAGRLKIRVLGNA